MRLENGATLEDIEQSRQIIDYWVDEMQENAMADVPIIIVFITKVQERSLIDTMLADRDK